MPRSLLLAGTALAVLAAPTAAAAAWYVVMQESAPQVSDMSPCRVAEAVSEGDIQIAGPLDSQEEAEAALKDELRCRPPNFKDPS